MRSPEGINPNPEAEQPKEIWPGDLGPEIKSQQVGGLRLAAGVLVFDTESNQLGLITKIRKIQDPALHMKRPTLTLSIIEFADGHSEERWRGFTAVYQRMVESGRTGRLPIPEIPERYQPYVQLTTASGQEYRLADLVWVAGRLGKIALIQPGENPQVGVITKNRKGHERLYSLAPDQLTPVERDAEGRIIRPEPKNVYTIYREEKT